MKLLNTATIEEIAPLGPWVPKVAKDRLPNVSSIKPAEIHLPHHPLYRKGPQSLMRAIDLENRFRYNAKIQKLFLDKEGSIKPGAILLVDQVTSRMKPQPKRFAGLLLGVRKSGLQSSIVLRGSSMGIGIEMRIPIYSPLIREFVVLKDVPEKWKSRQDLYYLRDELNQSEIDYEEIEKLAAKHKFSSPLLPNNK